MEYTDNITALDAVGSTTTSATIDLSKRKAKSIQFISANTVGSAVFSVSVSNDGTNFVVYNRLTDNVTNTNTQSDTRVAASSALSTATSKIYFFPEGDYFRYIQVTCTVTTGGAYTAVIQAGD